MLVLVVDCKEGNLCVVWGCGDNVLFIIASVFNE